MMLQTNTREIFYTPYEEVNTMLNHFVQDAEKESIWASIDAAGLRQNSPGNSFPGMLYSVLEQASLGCVETTPPKNRFIRLRSRVMQKKLFLRIQYSCSERKPQNTDLNFTQIRKMLKSADGYFKMLQGDDIMDIQIAVPVA